MKKLSNKEIDQLLLQAKKSERGRSFLRLHDPSDKLLKLINAIQPNSYIPPHKHTKGRMELFVVLRGAFVAIFFDERGRIVDTIRIDANGDNVLVEVPGGTWHTLWATKKNSVVLEVIQGPFDEKKHKVNASWAPAESASDVRDYMKSILKICNSYE